MARVTLILRYEDHEACGEVSVMDLRKELRRLRERPVPTPVAELSHRAGSDVMHAANDARLLKQLMMQIVKAIDTEG